MTRDTEDSARDLFSDLFFSKLTQVRGEARASFEELERRVGELHSHLDVIQAHVDTLRQRCHALSVRPAKPPAVAQVSAGCAGDG